MPAFNLPQLQQTQLQDNQQLGEQQQDPPPPPMGLRRQTHSFCEDNNCRAVREEYGAGYQCWNCGHVQQSDF